MWALNNINMLKAALQLFSFHLYFVCCDSMWHLRIFVDLAIFPHSGHEKLWEKQDSFRICTLSIGLSDSGSSFLHGQIWLKEILHTEHLCTALLEFLRSTQRGKHLIFWSRVFEAVGGSGLMLCGFSNPCWCCSLYGNWCSWNGLQFCDSSITSSCCSWSNKCGSSREMWFYDSLILLMSCSWSENLCFFKGLIELRSRNVSPNLIIPSPWLLTLLLNSFQ